MIAFILVVLFALFAADINVGYKVTSYKVPVDRSGNKIGEPEVIEEKFFFDKKKAEECESSLRNNV